MYYSFKISRMPLILLLLFLNTFSYAQNKNNYQNIISRIDSLAKEGLPKSALAEVDQLDSLAHRNNNTAQLIRASIYRITFQAYLEENALVPVINTLKADIQKSVFPVKPVLQSLLAELYWNYYLQNRWQFSQRSRLETPDADFTRWDLSTLVQEVSRLYRFSLQDTLSEQQTPVGILDGVLLGDKTTRYLRPSLYDLLVHRAFKFFLTEYYPAFLQPHLSFNWNEAAFFSDNRSFAHWKITTPDTNSIVYWGIRYLQQVTLFHLEKGDREALADLDIERLGFVYNQADFFQKDSLYLQALQDIARVYAGKPSAADALFAIGKYYLQKDSLKTAFTQFRNVYFNYPETLSGKNAIAQLKEIRERQLSATVENSNVPGKPILALLEYKNIKTVKVRVYKLSQQQLDKYQDLRAVDLQKDWSRLVSHAAVDSVLEYLNQFKPSQNFTLSVPGWSDYRSHSTEFKIGPLPSGQYVLLVQTPSGQDTSLIKLADFSVNRLAWISRVVPDGQLELRVMDRETGRPLKGVDVTLVEKGSRFNQSKNQSESVETTEHGLTGQDGLFKSARIPVAGIAGLLGVSRGPEVSKVSGIPGKSEVSGILVNLIYKKDTILNDPAFMTGTTGHEDEKVKEKTVLFTDRGIYRPGQVLYFKGMQLEIQKGKSKIAAQRDVHIQLLGVNSKELGSQDFKTNEFGTFSGSFFIPQNILNGRLTLLTPDGSVSVQVEEYKRPVFTIEFDSIKTSYHFNDSVRVKGKAMAFSGYGLSQARVAYRIRRMHSWEDYMALKEVYGTSYSAEPETEIAADTVTTDNQGNFLLTFKAVPGDKRVSTTIYRYAINVDITEAGGATYSSVTSVAVGSHDIQFEADLPMYQFAKDSAKIWVYANTLNQQNLAGDLTIQVYALQSPDRLFKDRLWNPPDQYILSRREYKKLFPDYAYQGEDQYAHWPRKTKITEFSAFCFADEEKNGIDLDILRKQPSGVYQVVVQIRAANGDTASVTDYVNVINGPAVPATNKDWVIPVSNTVLPGGKVELLAGMGTHSHVLLEQYRGSALLSSQWLNIQKTQRCITIPATDVDNNIPVQLMMVYHNRLYSRYNYIPVAHPEKKLDLSLVTFRNLLEPGQKEQWKLQISGYKNEKQAAEMVACLYDVSLDRNDDDFVTPAWWNYPLTNMGDRQDWYFNWGNYNFIHKEPTQALALFYSRRSGFFAPGYEQLNFFGYNYYGGYNSAYQRYLNSLQEQARKQAYDQQLESTYLKNAALIKSGYEISGRVIAENKTGGLQGISITIKDSSIATFTNSDGYFKIKVPVNGVLVLSGVGYLSQEKTVRHSENIIFTLKADSQYLQEVTVVGFGTRKVNLTAGSVVTISPNSLNIDKSEQSDVATLLEGKITGTGAIAMKMVPEMPSSSIRRNFNETAFFYPQLHTNEQGQILIDFTLPEALTKWRFKAFAHTQDLASGYLEREVITRKPLMVSAYMPRFLREGDTLLLSARLTNLTQRVLSCKVRLQFFNAVNMLPLVLLCDTAGTEQVVQVAANTNQAVFFKLAIPVGPEALTYRITAVTGDHSDGEENTLPVLPARMLVTESMPVSVRPGQTKTFTFDRLVHQQSSTLISKTLTLEYTQNPAWCALQSLPYLMEFPDECSEQTFSRYYANSLSASIIKHYPEVRQVFDQWKMADSQSLLSNLEKNPGLKSILLEETPWLQDAVNESEQKKRIALLFDINKLSEEQEQNLDKLQKKQLPGGGFAWFGGQEADRYITQHIIAGLGQLYHLKIIDTASQKAATLRRHALSYLDNELLADYTKAIMYRDYRSDGITAIEIHAWYARSYYPDIKMSETLEAVQQLYLVRAARQWPDLSLYEQGLVALTFLHYGQTDLPNAIIRSLLETAQQSPEEGMYWAKNRSGYFWYQSPLETQALLIELFTEAGKEQKAVEEMKLWLLRNKQVNNWSTTKATAAACYVLLMDGDANLLSRDTHSTIELNGKDLTQLKPDLSTEAGTGYVKTSWSGEQVTPSLGKVRIVNRGTTVNWGALHWSYTEKPDKITSASTNIQLERHYFVEKRDHSGLVLIAADTLHPPRTGDVLKVVVYLKADRDFEYVHLKDMSPSGTEPVGILSTFQYQDGLYYYREIKDAATHFFINRLHKGNYVFEYRLRVTQSGNFSTGITSVQSMYAPEFNAHSEGRRLDILP